MADDDDCRWMPMIRVVPNDDARWTFRALHGAIRHNMIIPMFLLPSVSSFLLLDLFDESAF